MAGNLLSVRNLRKSWRDGLPVLSIDSLDLGEGEKVALVGNNGAGKTTLMRILAGLLPMDDGTLVWLGKNVPVVRVGKDVTYLHQQPHMFDRSVRANIEYALERKGAPLSEADQGLAWAGLSDKAELPARSLSVGEKRRLALARVRATAAPLLLLDEPTANLDASGVAAVERMINDMASAGRSVMASFQVDEVPKGLGEIRQIKLASGNLEQDRG